MRADLEQTPGFDVSGLKVLVLDEADRVLDMGFAATLNAVLDYLPPARQTLLFSATQTKSVRDLARLSLSAPEYIAVDEAAAHAAPMASRKPKHGGKAKEVPPLRALGNRS